MLEIITVAYSLAAFGMSAALTKTYPQYAGWRNVTRSIAWPVTLYEVYADLMD